MDAFYFGKRSDISPLKARFLALSPHGLHHALRQMRTCILPILAGIALSGMARELSPTMEKDGEQAIDGKLLDQSAVSNRIENVFDLEDEDIRADPVSYTHLTLPTICSV